LLNHLKSFVALKMYVLKFSLILIILCTHFKNRPIAKHLIVSYYVNNDRKLSSSFYLTRNKQLILWMFETVKKCTLKVLNLLPDILFVRWVPLFMTYEMKPSKRKISCQKIFHFFISIFIFITFLLLSFFENWTSLNNLVYLKHKSN
jgi:hypothetical protein